MVNVSFYHRDREHEMIACGHATGSPEICAAVSAIMTALAGWIENNRDHLDGKEAIFVDLQEGDTCILFTGDDCAEAAFSVAEIGIAQLANSFPEYVSVAWYE